MKGFAATLLVVGGSICALYVIHVLANALYHEQTPHEDDYE